MKFPKQSVSIGPASPLLRANEGTPSYSPYLNRQMRSSGGGGDGGALVRFSNSVSENFPSLVGAFSNSCNLDP